MFSIRASLVRSWKPLALGACMALLPALASAGSPEPDYVQTGIIVRKGPSGVDYTVVHEVKSRPSAKSATALVDADVPKRFRIIPARPLRCDVFKTQLRVGLVRNGMSRTAADSLLAACSGQAIAAHGRIIVAYSPATKVTTLSIEKMGTTQVTGLPAMKSVWGVWLGSSDSAQEKRDLSSKL